MWHLKSQMGSRITIAFMRYYCSHAHGALAKANAKARCSSRGDAICWYAESSRRLTPDKSTLISPLQTSADCLCNESFQSKNISSGRNSVKGTMLSFRNIVQLVMKCSPAQLLCQRRLVYFYRSCWLQPVRQPCKWRLMCKTSSASSRCSQAFT